MHFGLGTLQAHVVNSTVYTTWMDYARLVGELTLVIFWAFMVRIEVCYRVFPIRVCAATFLSLSCQAGP